MTELAQYVNAETPAIEPPREQSVAYVPILDSIRGAAILAVMIFHATVFTMDSNPVSGFDRVYLNVMSAGWCGVDMFFVLSGFLITRILLYTKDQEDFFRNFYARRVLRIFPLYYIAVTGYLVIAHVFHLQYGATAAPWMLTYTSNLIVAANPAFVIPLPMAHFWSLAIEEQFYLIWPLVVLLLSKRGLVKACGFFFLLALAVRCWMVSTGNVVGAYRFTVCRLDALVLGALVAVIMTSADRSAFRRWSWTAFGVSAMVLSALAFRRGSFGTEDGAVVAYGISALAVFFATALFLIMSAPRTASARGGALAVLAVLGRYAYGMYVFHQPLATVLLRLKSTRAMPVLFGSQVPFQLLLLATFCGCTLLLAMLSFHLIEKQFLRLKVFF